MKRRYLSSIVLGIAVIISCGSGFPQTTQEKVSSPAAQPTLVVPAETTIPLVLRNTINSRTTRPGQPIYCDTIFPITVGNRIVIPTGSAVKGSITQVVRPGRVKGKGQIGIRFETLILPNGTTVPLRATLSGFGTTGQEGFKPDESKVERASSKGEKAGKVVGTTVTGAEIGTLAGVAGHSAGKGLGIGSAAGAAGGLIWVLASRGKQIVLPPGTNFELQLNESLSFTRDELEPLSRYEQGPALPHNE